MNKKRKRPFLWSIIFIAVLLIFLPALWQNSGHVLNSQALINSIPPSPPKPTPENLPNPPTAVNSQENFLHSEKISSQQSLSREAISNDQIQKKINLSSKQARNLPEPKAYVLELGEFANSQQAKKLVEQLKKKGFAAFTHFFLEKDKKITQVYVGPEIDEASLMVTQQQIKKMFQLKGDIKPFDPLDIA